MEIKQHIVMREGRARIARRGHLKAYMVARMYLWEKATIEEVMEHSELTAAEVHSAIAYYYDNQEELDVEYEETVAEARKTAQTLEKFTAKIAARRLQAQARE